MRDSLRFSISLAFALALGGAITGCGDDEDTNDNAQTGSDASVSEAGSGGRTSAAGRSGNGGATAGRSGSAGASVAGASGARAGAGGGAGRTNAGGSSAGGAPASGGTGGANAGLSDAQIAAITTAANTAEIQLGTLALGRTRKPEVRSFAQEMIEMHGAAQDRSSLLLQTLNLVPVQSTLSTQLEQDAQRVATMLQNTPDASFDLAYVQSQVEIHVQVLKLFDDKLLPNVTEVALKTDLTLARGDVQRHLAEAQSLLALVQIAPPDLDAGAEDAGN